MIKNLRFWKAEMLRQSAFGCKYDKDAFYAVYRGSHAPGSGYTYKGSNTVDLILMVGFCIRDYQKTSVCGLLSCSSADD
jgi:hypothetical protein